VKLCHLVVALVMAGAPSVTGAQNVTYDLIIRGGRIVDGTGAPSYRADIAVSNGRIVRLQMPRSAQTPRPVVIADVFAEQMLQCRDIEAARFLELFQVNGDGGNVPAHLDDELEVRHLIFDHLIQLGHMGQQLCSFKFVQAVIRHFAKDISVGSGVPSRASEAQRPKPGGGSAAR